MTACSVAGCDKAQSKRGWCQMHYRRWWRTRTLDLPGRVPGYIRAHELMGRASDHACASCGEPARDWSYKGGDPNERTDQAGRYASCKYSLDSSYYEPLCRRCHVNRDTAGEKHAGAKLTKEQVLAIRAQYATGCVTHQLLAEQYGVSRAAVTAILARKVWKGV